MAILSSEIAGGSARRSGAITVVAAVSSLLASLVAISGATPPIVNAADPASSFVRVSVDVDGGDPNGRSDSPSISYDGEVVVFESMATDLVASSSHRDGKDVFVRDLTTGVTRMASAGIPGSQDATESRVSRNGDFVVFSLGGSVYRYEVATGALSGPARGIGGVPYGSQSHPDISADGRWVVFQATGDAESVYLFDVENNIATLLSGPEGGFLPFIGDDARFIVFESLEFDQSTGTGARRLHSFDTTTHTAGIALEYLVDQYRGWGWTNLSFDGNSVFTYEGRYGSPFYAAQYFVSAGDLLDESIQTEVSTGWDDRYNYTSTEPYASAPAASADGRYMIYPFGGCIACGSIVNEATGASPSDYPFAAPPLHFRFVEIATGRSGPVTALGDC